MYEDQADGVGAPMKILCAIVCFGIAVLMIYICLAAPVVGTAMGAIRDIMRGIGGSLSLVLSLIFVWIGMLLIFSCRGRRIRVWRVLMNALLFLSIFTAVHLFSAKNIIENQMTITSYANFLNMSYRFGSGGGILGAVLAYPLFINLGAWGGFIVTLLIAFLSLTATGRTKQFFNWTRNRADERQLRSEQRANERKSEHTFDTYDELDDFDPPAARPAKRSRPVRRTAEEDCMLINTPAPKRSRSESVRAVGRTAETPDEAFSSEAVHSAAKRSSRKKPPELSPVTSGFKKLYKENIDPDAIPETKPEDLEDRLEIPKSLRKIRENKKKGATESTSGFGTTAAEQAEDEIFTVKSDAKDESFRPQNYDVPEPKKKSVTEGVRALSLDDEEDDDAPFDIPEEPASMPKPMPRSGRKKAEPEPEPVNDEESYNYPPIDLLAEGEHVKNTQAAKEADREKADLLIATLQSFGIETRLIGVAHGPAVTRFELQPAPGVKVSRITSLADDIALNLAALSVRIEAPIPGKAAVGVEIPNDTIEMVHLRDVLESPDARRHPSKIAFGLGKDNSGRYIVADIAKMPHVLIAGQTGSGKSVCINSLIASILYRATPDEVRMILVDPKVVELSIYNDIPHLIAPVVTDPKKAASALNWAVAEMDRRYKCFAERGVRDIKGYNKNLPEGEKIMPQMLIVIDELADLMMVAPGEVEDSICRLAQLARAAGIHLVIATQRPSVNVITGIIKANIPTRIAFSVASQVDSRTMIDHGGAEKLLGNGDMLFVPSGINKPMRVQGAFLSDDEVHAIVTYIKERTEVTYDEDVIEKIENSVRSDAEKEEIEDEYDPKLEEAVEIVVEAGQASVSMLQRRMRVGYARAGRLIDEMERRGIVSEADGAKPRTVLISREQFKSMFES